jgi:hypothetical protein
MIEFGPIERKPGSDTRYINVSKDGKPWAQIWTFVRKGEKHPWHAKPLHGKHASFYSCEGGLAAAKKYLEEYK